MVSSKIKKEKLSDSSRLSVFYHNIFDYPLSESDIENWCIGKAYKGAKLKFFSIEFQDGHFFLRGRKKLVATRRKREIFSERKIKIAQKASQILAKIPTVVFVGITGSVAMKNASENSDIDFLIIAKKNTVWFSRGIGLVALIFSSIDLRKYGEKNEQDKLCLNIWLDESAFKWQEQNIFTAHEIRQMMPVFDRDGAYMRFVNKNDWVSEFWTGKEVYWEDNFKMKNKKNIVLQIVEFLAKVLDPPAFFLQKVYMKRKITNETIEKHCALFHPEKISGKIVKKFEEALKAS